MCQINSPSFMSYSGPSDNSKFSGSALLTTTSFKLTGAIFSTLSRIRTSWACSEYIIERLDSCGRSGSVSICSLRTIILGPDAVYGRLLVWVASNSRTVIAPPPISVEAVFCSITSISHARSFRLEFLRINSPSMDCCLTVPSGFSTDSSVSFRVTYNLSPGIESTSAAGRRLPDKGG